MELLLQNWVAQVDMESSWLTDVSQAYLTLAEQRRCLRTMKPRRQLTVTWLSMNRALAFRLQMHLLRSVSGPQQVPLYQDVTEVTEESGGTTLYCDTSHRRFFVGQQVVVHSFAHERAPTNIQVRTIAAVNEDSLDLSSGLVGTYDEGDKVYPLLSCLTGLKVTGRAHTDAYYEVRAEFVEALGNDAVPASETDGNLPEGYEEHPHPNGEDYPVFHVQPDWSFAVSPGVQRIGRRLQVGRFEEVDVQGQAPGVLLDCTIGNFDREEFWGLLQFFDSRRGQLRPFWLGNPLVVFSATGIGTTKVVVRAPAGGVLADAQEFVKFVCIRLLDGTTYVREVDGGITQVGQTWELAFQDEALPAHSLAEVDSVTSAHLVRFSKDSFEESWVTDEHSTVSFSVEELHEEDEIQLSGFPEPYVEGC